MRGPDSNFSCIQTSNDTKLKFYSYYKQATAGPCELSKPGFWDVVNRAKWDAWHKLGNMSKEEAMKGYVQEFVKVIQETPLESLDDPSLVNDFIGMMGPYIEYAPEEIKKKHLKINGKANGLNNNSEDYVEDFSNSRLPQSSNDYSNRMSDDGSENYASPVNGHSLNGGNESDSDIFSDTLEGVNEDDPEEVFASNSNPMSNNPMTQSKGPSIINVRGGDHRLGTRNGNSPANASGSRGNQSTQQSASSNWALQATSSSTYLGSAGGSRRSGGGLPTELASDVNEQLALAVIRLQHTMEQVVLRLDSLETLLTQRSNIPNQVAEKKSARWSIFGMSPKLAVLIFAWPLIVQFLIYYIRRRQRHL
ncbi:acyl-CoA-binding domain-containing protein 5 isoform X2 [Parasteatoda tepidariorum]|uniref:acyl-CoA-binding domain-containing protein 5 isoform X2 n=1 Tax=Parasteatoda tepidariorum TaxID=114398 RepID=UPI00077F936F|nr:acyl-CoA-binding domain-containing protein 5 isoform X2 [Parasteatoda tepidariorum]